MAVASMKERIQPENGGNHFRSQALSMEEHGASNFRQILDGPLGNGVLVVSPNAAKCGLLLITFAIIMKNIIGKNPIVSPVGQNLDSVGGGDLFNFFFAAKVSLSSR